MCRLVMIRYATIPAITTATACDSGPPPSASGAPLPAPMAAPGMRQLRNDPIAGVDRRRATRLEAGRGRRKAEVLRAAHEAFGGAFRDRRDRERRVDPERRRDRRRIDAVEALVVEGRAEVVDGAHGLGLRHPAAAGGMP